MLTFLDFFRQPNLPGRDKYLSRLFGLFSENVVRAWCTLPDSPYDNIGRPYLKRRGEARGHTLDFTLRERASGQVYIAEMKCELEFEGYRYLQLRSPDQVRHHEGGQAFRKFMEVAHEPNAIPVTVGGQATEISGAVLVWGAATPEGADAVRKAYGLYEVLTVEGMLPALRANPPAEWSEQIKLLRIWSWDLFEFLLPEDQGEAWSNRRK